MYAIRSYYGQRHRSTGGFGLGDGAGEVALEEFVRIIEGAIPGVRCIRVQIAGLADIMTLV